MASISIIFQMLFEISLYKWHVSVLTTTKNSTTKKRNLPSSFFSKDRQQSKPIIDRNKQKNTSDIQKQVDWIQLFINEQSLSLCLFLFLHVLSIKQKGLLIIILFVIDIFFVVSQRAHITYLIVKHCTKL